VGLRITTNLLSLATQRSLALTTRALARSLQRLASGSRINTGRDDPAGLAMASGLESQRRGMLQAVRNINDSRGFLETADGAMAEQTNMIQRMRELAVQASNGTLNDTTRAYLNNEFQSLLTEFNRLTTQTQFNGLNLLDGSFGTKNVQVGSQKGHTIAVGLTSMMASKVFTTTTTTTTSGSSTSTGTGTFAARTTVASVGNANSVFAADLNGDGNLDLIIANSGDNSVTIALGNGNGTFNSETQVGTGNNSSSAIAYDLNGDGKIDLISSDTGDGTISILLGNGNGTFIARATTSSGAQPGYLRSSDLNGDGKLDLVTANSSTNTGSILLGNGNGTFLTRTTIATGSTPYSIFSADINGDGKIDLISADDGTTTASIFLGNGNGTFLARSTVRVGSGPLTVISVDLNGDGKLDLVSSEDSETVSILLGNGNGTFKTRTTAQTGSTLYPWITSADINGDSYLDLITSDDEDITLTILMGNGNGTFQSRKTLLTSADPSFVIVADVDNDGVGDIINSDYIPSGASIFLANSTTTLTTGGTATTTTAASIYLTTQSNAQDALSVLDGALAYVNSARANIGALQSRLEFASSVNQNTIENISAARSQIMDTDIAAETAEFARLQILQHAGVAVLGQANLATQLSLKLL
jgi:flagellin-like hook-associated protein FlgL